MTIFQRILLLLILTSASHYLQAQQQFFVDSFENKILKPVWHPVSGNWHIATAKELKIVSPQNGSKNILYAEDAGFLGLLIDIPDSITARKVKVSFYYYTLSKGPVGSVEIEFHKRNWKDGLRGKPFRANLPSALKWLFFQKTITIPAEGTSVWVNFSQVKTTYFSTVVLAAVK